MSVSDCFSCMLAMSFPGTNLAVMFLICIIPQTVLAVFVRSSQHRKINLKRFPLHLLSLHPPDRFL